MRFILQLSILCLIVYGGLVNAHNDEDHSGIKVDPGTSAAAPIPLDVGGPFQLINQDGQLVTNETYLGKHMLVFFGYASCKNMCSITLSRIGQALDLVPNIDALVPLVITVDPERDTPDVLKTELAKYNHSLIGLTGDHQQLKQAYLSYNQKPSSAGKDWDEDEIISHSSFIYLIGPDGKFETLFPPILNPDSMAAIINKYIDKTS